MKNGSVIVDVAIDQGGCIETARPTTHQRRPTLWTASCTTASRICPARWPDGHDRSLNATLPYALRIADKGDEKAAAEDPGLGEGINLVGGEIVYEPVATAYAQGAPVAAW